MILQTEVRVLVVEGRVESIAGRTKKRHEQGEGLLLACIGFGIGFGIARGSCDGRGPCRHGQNGGSKRERAGKDSMERAGLCGFLGYPCLHCIHFPAAGHRSHHRTFHRSLRNGLAPPQVQRSMNN